MSKRKRIGCVIPREFTQPILVHFDMSVQSVICGDNHTTCVNDHIGGLREVFDEATCLDIFRGYYEAYSEYWHIGHSFKHPCM